MKDLNDLKFWLSASIWFTMIGYFAGLVINLIFFWDQSFMPDLASWKDGIRGFQVLSLLTGTVLFAIWLSRAYANLEMMNLPALRSNSRFVGWAIFIPFYNLIAPYQIVKEVWQGSQAFFVINRPISKWREGRADIIDYWWGAYLTFALLPSFFKFSVRVMEVGVPDWMSNLTIFANFIAGFMLLKIIGEITSLQSNFSLKQDRIRQAKEDPDLMEF